MNIKNWIKQLIALQRDRKLRASVKEISSRISLREKDGHIYIVCMGTAVWRLKDFSTCEESVRMLKDMRAFAREYALGEDKKKTNN